MRFELAPTEEQNTFTAYGDGYVQVNATRYHNNLIVLPNSLIPEWTQAVFETLSRKDFECLATLNVDIVLLGTGDELRFPRPELLQPLIQAQTGLEAMDIHAACRTYNMLVSEGRTVAAALLFA